MSASTPAGEMPPQAGFRDGVPGHWFGSLFIPRMAGGETPPDPKDDDPPKGGDPKDDDFDRERALATIRKLRENEKATKAQLKELDDLRAKIKAAEDKEKTEAERLAGTAKETAEKLAAAEQRAADLALRLTVERTAAKLGFHDPDDAFRLLDRKSVELDDDGEPKNVETLLAALAKAKPHLVKAEGEQKPPAAQKSTPPTPKPDGKAPTRDELVAEKVEKLKASGSYARLG